MITQEFRERLVKEKTDALSQLCNLIYDAKRVLYFELPNTELTKEEKEIDQKLKSVLEIIETRYWVK